MLAFNSSRPLFRNNPRLRRAINFALDREALLATSGGSVVARVTDQYLPHVMPGFRDASDLPGGGGPRIARASLRAGTYAGQKAVFYTTGTQPAARSRRHSSPPSSSRDRPRRRRSSRSPSTSRASNYLEKLTAHGAAWDIALVLWTPNIPDAHAYLNLLLESQLFGGETLSRLRSRARESRSCERAVRLPPGQSAKPRLRGGRRHARPRRRSARAAERRQRGDARLGPGRLHRAAARARPRRRLPEG